VRSDRETRNLVITILNLIGPNLGAPILQALFPDMPRREVEDLVRRYKRLYAKKSELELMTLRWLRPGWVWAMDHSDPPSPIDGIYPVAFAVRDLASSNQLEWGGLPGKETRSAKDILEALFIQHGPPLVLKSDNGSPFISAEMREFLEKWGVVLLLSPIRTPRYNGGAEAGIGSMKRRTHIEAALHGRVGCWTSDDLEAARSQANETGRPWGRTKGTPAEVWASREPVLDVDRRRFAEDLKYYRDKVRKENGYLLDAGIDRKTAARIERLAMARALVARGILEIRRKRVPLPLQRLFSVGIS
jgi:transposase InsO family protein